MNFSSVLPTQTRNIIFLSFKSRSYTISTLASVEKYNPMTSIWEYQAPMNYPRMGVACAKHNDKIWAAGGMSGSRRKPLTDCVECYDIERNQ